MARAFGSYPKCRWFKSDYRYHLHGPLVKRLRHRPFTAKTGVRFSYGSPFFLDRNSRHDIIVKSFQEIRGINSIGRVSPCHGESREFESRIPLHNQTAGDPSGCLSIRHHSQAVRQRSAKPLCTGSNPVGASTRKPVNTAFAGFLLFPVALLLHC